MSWSRLVALCLISIAASCEVGPDGDKPKAPTPTLDPAEARGPAAGDKLPLAPDQGLGYPRFPDIRGGLVVFSAEGDLWMVSDKGGLARRLTVHPGHELFAKFSPRRQVDRLQRRLRRQPGQQAKKVLTSTARRRSLRLG